MRKAGESPRPFSSSSLIDSEPVYVNSRKRMQALTIEERQTQSPQRIGDIVDLGEVITPIRPAKPLYLLLSFLLLL